MFYVQFKKKILLNNSSYTPSVVFCPFTVGSPNEKPQKQKQQHDHEKRNHTTPQNPKTNEQKNEPTKNNNHETTPNQPHDEKERKHDEQKNENEQKKKNAREKTPKGETTVSLEAVARRVKGCGGQNNKCEATTENSPKTACATLDEPLWGLGCPQITNRAATYQPPLY